MSVGKSANDFASLRHDSYSATPTQSSSSRSQKCPSPRTQRVSASSSRRQRSESLVSGTLSRVSSSFQPLPACEISEGMAVATVRDSARKARLDEESARLPTPCDSDVESNVENDGEQYENVALASPALSALTPTTESAGSHRVVASAGSSLSSLDDDLEMPPTPRPCTCQLPMSPSIVTLPLPRQMHTPPPSPGREPPPQVSSPDPYADVPLVRPLAEVWSSLDRNSSLSLTAEPSDEKNWPFVNALGIWVDPSINVSAWDAGGFIRATRPPRRRLESRPMQTAGALDG